MLSELENGFELLAEYAERNKQDPDLADEVRNIAGKTHMFLMHSGLDDIPHSELAKLRGQLGAEGYARKQTHLAILAEEALRVEGGKFVHGRKTDVINALMNRAANGDKRVRADYSEKTMLTQFHEAGEFIFSNSLKLLAPGYHDAFPIPAEENTIRELTYSIEDIENEEEYLILFKTPTWKSTIKTLSETLPPRTTIYTVSYLLTDFSKQARISDVEERINAVQPLKS